MKDSPARNTGGRKFVLKRIEGARTYEMIRSGKFTALITHRGNGWVAIAGKDHMTEPFPTALAAADAIESVEKVLDEAEQAAQKEE